MEKFKVKEDPSIKEISEIFEEGVKPIAKEKSITNGIIDILGKDKDGNMVIELKREGQLLMV